jgi:hypothetical protein
MSPSLRRAALPLLLAVVVVPTVAVSLVADNHGPHTPEACTNQGVVVIDYAQEPAKQEYDSPRVSRYENLSERERAVFDRAYTAMGSRVETSERRYHLAEAVPGIVVRNDSVYRFQRWLDGCPRVAGVPPSLNGVVSVYLRLESLLTGPLAPLLVVCGGLGAAAWLGKKIEY